MSKRPNLAAAGSNALGMGTFSSQSNFDIGRVNSKPFDGFKTSNLPSKPSGFTDAKNKTQGISVAAIEKDLMRDLDDLEWELQAGNNAATFQKKSSDNPDRSEKLKPKLFFKKEEKKQFNDTRETKATTGHDEWDLPTGGLGNIKKLQPSNSKTPISNTLQAIKKPQIKEKSDRNNLGDWDLPNEIPAPGNNQTSKPGIKPTSNPTKSGNDVDKQVVGTKNIKNNVNMELEAQDAEFEKLYQCPEGCGRSFKRNALEKHIKVCKTVFQKNEETGNAKNRGASVNLIKKDPTADSKEANRSESVQKWKKDSEQFRKMLRKGGKSEKADEDDLPGAQHHKPEQPQKICDICSKSFNEQAFIRHRPLCESKKKYMEGGYDKK